MGRDLHCLSLHYVMFLPTLQNQATNEQLDKWLGLVKMYFKIIFDLIYFVLRLLAEVLLEHMLKQN